MDADGDDDAVHNDGVDDDDDDDGGGNHRERVSPSSLLHILTMKTKIIVVHIL